MERPCDCSLGPRPIRPIFYYMDGRERSGNIAYQKLCRGGGVSGDAINVKRIIILNA